MPTAPRYRRERIIHDKPPPQVSRADPKKLSRLTMASCLKSKIPIVGRKTTNPFFGLTEDTTQKNSSRFSHAFDGGRKIRAFK
jgi:hypothetical protein